MQPQPLNTVDFFPGFNCYACGPNHPHGLKLNFFKNGDEVFARFNPREDLAGIPGILHGGFQTMLMDEILWWSVFQFKQQFCLTQDLNVQFAKPVFLNEELIISGKPIREEKNRVFATGEIRSGDRQLVSASGTFYLPSRQLMARAIGVDLTKVPESILKFLPE